MGSMKDQLGDGLYVLPTPPAATAFDGQTYKPERDHARLAGQMQTVFDAMKDGIARTLAQIEEITSAPQASISARLRDLRKEKFGGHTVERISVGGGLFLYKLMVRK